MRARNFRVHGRACVLRGNLGPRGGVFKGAVLLLALGDLCCLRKIEGNKFGFDYPIWFSWIQIVIRRCVIAKVGKHESTGGARWCGGGERD